MNLERNTTKQKSENNSGSNKWKNPGNTGNSIVEGIPERISIGIPKSHHENTNEIVPGGLNDEKMRVIPERIPEGLH